MVNVIVINPDGFRIDPSSSICEYRTTKKTRPVKTRFSVPEEFIVQVMFK